MHQRSKSLSKLSLRVEERVDALRHGESKERFYQRLYEEKLGSQDVSIALDLNSKGQREDSSSRRVEGNLKSA